MSPAEERRAARRMRRAGDDLRAAHRELAGVLARLPARGRVEEESGGADPRARVAHLVTAAECIREGLTLSPPGPRPRAGAVQRQAWLSLRTTWQVPASLERLPAAEGRGGDHDLPERWTRALGALLALVETLPAARLSEAWWQHPVLGPLNVLDWCRLLRILVRHLELALSGGRERR